MLAILLAAASITSPQSGSKPLIEAFPKMALGAGCSLHRPGTLTNQIDANGRTAQWIFWQKATPHGKGDLPSPALMQIGGQQVQLRPLQQTGSIPLLWKRVREAKRNATAKARYKAGDIEVEVQETVKGHGYEHTDFDAVVTVKKSGVVERVQAKGSCGA